MKLTKIIAVICVIGFLSIQTGCRHKCCAPRPSTSNCGCSAPNSVIPPTSIGANASPIPAH